MGPSLQEAVSSPSRAAHCAAALPALQIPVRQVKNLTDLRVEKLVTVVTVASLTRHRPAATSSKSVSHWF